MARRSPLRHLPLDGLEEDLNLEIVKGDRQAQDKVLKKLDRRLQHAVKRQDYGVQKAIVQLLDRCLKVAIQLREAAKDENMKALARAAEDAIMNVLARSLKLAAVSGQFCARNLVLQVLWDHWDTPLQMFFSSSLPRQDVQDQKSKVWEGLLKGLKGRSGRKRRGYNPRRPI